MDDLFDEFKALEGCCLHDPQWKPVDVKDILVWYHTSPEGYGSTEQIIIARLEDGGFGLLTSASDTTGHGCQCGSATARSETLHDVLRHLTQDELIKVLANRETDPWA